MGRLIPAGTGMEYYRRVKIAGEELEEELVAETEPPLADDLGGYAEDTRLTYSGGLAEAGEELGGFEAE